MEINARPICHESNALETSWHVSLPPRSDPRMPEHIRDLLLNQ